VIVMPGYELASIAYPAVSEGTLAHVFAIDLPLAMVLAGPLLLVAPTVWKRRYGVTVPAVMITVLGAAFIYAIFDSRINLANIPAESAREIAGQQAGLEKLALGAILAALVLFAGALVLRRVVSRSLDRGATRAAAAVFGFIYLCSSMWLVSAAHEGAILADRLAEHANP
jgi:hypothetical protein